MELIQSCTVGPSVVVRCLTDTVEGLLSNSADPLVTDLLELIWQLTDWGIDTLRDVEFLGLVLKLHEIVAPHLATDLAADFLRVRERLFTEPTGFSEDVYFTYQRGMLSIMAVIFKTHGHEAAAEAHDIGLVLLQLIGSHFIVARTECIGVFIQIVEALQEQVQEIASPLWDLTQKALDESDPALISLVSPLIASLFTWATSAFLEVVDHVGDRLYSALHAPQCTSECLPNLLRATAIIIRALPPPLSADMLDAWFREYKSACEIRLTVDDDIAIEYMNAMYQAIFSGLGALIYQARNDEAFGQAHSGQWCDMIPRFVSDFALIAAHETLDAYIGFLEDAVEYLPLVCVPEVTEFVVRVPVLLGVLGPDPNTAARATALWNRLTGDLGEVLLRMGLSAPLPEDFDWDAFEVAVLGYFASLEEMHPGIGEFFGQ
jgi:hypothetical protein